MMRCPSYMMGGGLMSLMFSLMVVMFSLCAFPLVDGEETNYIRRRLAVEHVETHVPIRSTKRVEGAMIIDEKKYREGSVKSPARHKLQHAKDFSAALFGNATLDHYLVPPAGKDYRRDEDPSAFRVREWPAVFTLNCPDVKPLVRLGKPAGMDRGLLIAHKETWDQFIRQRESNPHRMMFNETDDVLVVFEDDVYETVPNIKQAMISEIENMNSDIKYLGWCMWSDKKLAPLCMHAYAMDANGARKLRKHIDVCSINPLDIQIQNACKNHNITWSLSCPDDVVFAKGSTCPVYDPTGNYMKEKKLSEGVHIPEIFNFIGWGGIFLQVGFDDYLPMDEIPNNTVIKGQSGRQVFLWNNATKTRHAFPNLQTFQNMGFDFDSEMVVTDWQLRSLPEGETLPPK